MGDCIDRQAAIEILATMQGLCTSKAALIQNSKIWQQIKDLPSADIREQLDNAYMHGYTEAEAKYRKILDEMPHWIPCSERLPEDKRPVFLCYNDGYIRVGYWFAADGWWHGLDDRMIELLRGDEITAWMPLPEPYREVEK